MNAKKLAAAIVIAIAASASSPGVWAEVDVEVRGYASCGIWVQGRTKNDAGGVANRFWVLGYLSGLASSSKVNILKGTDSQSIYLWIDTFCRANPLKDVADASEVLFQELRRQR